MKIENIVLGSNFSLLGFSLNFFGKTNQFLEEKKKIINDLINISDNIYHINDVSIKIEKKKDPRYSPKEKTIFIPLEYIDNDIFSVFRKTLGDKFEEVIIFHEMGHAVEVDRKPNINQIDIKCFQSLNYLFNGPSIPNNINYFLMENFKEGFADCYSAICHYKKHGDISIFDKISDARQIRYNEIKEVNGKNFVHPNFNIEAPRLLKEKIEELANKGVDFIKLPFISSDGENMEKYIEQSSIKGCINALLKELKTNDSFLSHFKAIGKKFTEEDRGKFKVSSYDEAIKDYANKNNIQIKDLTQKLNDSGIAPYFIELQKRSDKSIVSDRLIEELINNPKINRKVDSGLQIEDVRNFQLDVSMESNIKIESKENVILKINSMRYQNININININKNNTELKLK